MPQCPARPTFLRRYGSLAATVAVLFATPAAAAGTRSAQALPAPATSVKSAPVTRPSAPSTAPGIARAMERANAHSALRRNDSPG